MSETTAYGFSCLQCGERFEVELADAPWSGTVPCPACRSTLVRQTFESFLRDGPVWRRGDYEAYRDCHYG